MQNRALRVNHWNESVPELSFGEKQIPAGTDTEFVQLCTVVPLSPQKGGSESCFGGPREFRSCGQ